MDGKLKKWRKSAKIPLKSFPLLCRFLTSFSFFRRWFLSVVGRKLSDVCLRKLSMSPAHTSNQEKKEDRSPFRKSIRRNNDERREKERNMIMPEAVMRALAKKSIPICFSFYIFGEMSALMTKRGFSFARNAPHTNAKRRNPC